jgi:hypothetical protein
MVILVGGLVLTLFVGIGAGQEPSLAELVRRWGPIESVVHPAVPPVDLAQLVTEARLIARVRILGAKSFENGPEIASKITTDYTVDLLDISSKDSLFHAKLAIKPSCADMEGRYRSKTSS